jgi:MYXO-CTERM domain-containing protein
VNGALSPLYTFGPGAPNFPVTTVPNGFAQGIGHFSATFAQGVTRIEFVDWPQRIAIDRFDPILALVPEPETRSLVGLALVALVFARSRRRRG